MRKLKTKLLKIEKRSSSQNIQKDILTLVESTNQSMNNLLVFAKKIVGELTPEFKNVDLAEVQKMLSPIQQEITRKGILFDFKIDKGNQFVMADKVMLYVVLYELLKNACKFTDKGFITVHAKNENEYTAINVKDSGIGLSQNDKGNLFRIDIDRNKIGQEKSEKGTGFGLIVCEKLIGYHNSSIEVYSSLGAGAEFSFKLKKSNLNEKET